MIRDLLNPSSGFLDLREDSKGVIQVAGITEVSTINAQEVRQGLTWLLIYFNPNFQTKNPPLCFQIMELLMRGNKQRTQEPTAANKTSSRSHAVLQVAVKQQSRCRDVLQEVRFARLFMIDLAGSERAAQVCVSVSNMMHDGAGYLAPHIYIWCSGITMSLVLMEPVTLEIKILHTRYDEHCSTEQKTDSCQN